jgi:hypothetical protein
MIRPCLVPLACIALSAAALADEKGDENKDLDLIPQAAQASPATPAEAPGAKAGAASKIFLENAFTQSWLRAPAVAFPPPQSPAWQERLLLDVRKEWRPASDLSLNYSGRLNLRDQPGLDRPTHEDVINDLREAYASWEPQERLFLDAGRINLKSGVALGFNPTDFFKTRTVVEPLSVDPVVLREDRLGTLMLRAQRIWEGGSLTAAYAPAVASQSPIYTDPSLHSFDPMFDRTNAQDRFLLKGSADVAEGLSPELLAYHDRGRTRWGANLTASVSQSVVAYAEWSGGPRATLVDEALRFGRATGTLPPRLPDVLPDAAQQGFRSQLAAGASYTTEQPKITFNLEFNYNQVGFSGTDWDRWFQAGRGTTAASPIARELWYIRNYALDQQEPLGRSAAFLRADWVDAFVPKLELSGFVNTDLADGSSRIQLTADYYLSDRWTIGGVVLAELGGRRSDFGSLPQAGSVLLKVARYF